MKKDNSILTAPETLNVGPLLELYQIISGNSEKTASDLYYVLTTPSIEREELLLRAKSNPVISSNEVIRQQYIV